MSRAPSRGVVKYRCGRRLAHACLFVALWAAGVSANEPTIHIQAHRGAGSSLPENTIESFRWAWSRGVTPESDLRTTSDGVIVCFHDADLKRVPRHLDEKQKSTRFESLSLAEVQKLDVGSFRGKQFAGQRVPTLASVFAQMRSRPERLLYLDIKNVDLDQLAALVREYQVERQTIFTSEHVRLIRDWKKRMPDSLTLLWNRGTEQQLEKKMDDLRRTDFAGITHLQIHVHVGDLKSAEPFTPGSSFLRRLGNELKSRNIIFQVFPPNCSDERAFALLLDLGVASFATDHPEVALRAMRAFHETSAANSSKSSATGP